MRFSETEIAGAYIIDPQRVEDERGFFARTWSHADFESRGLAAPIAQCGISFNARKASLRGMHFQLPPFEEIKLVRCTKGAIYDVIVDLRPDSPSFTKWTAVELNDDNRRMLYIPAGLAHGFQTLSEGAEVFYQLSQVYSPEHARGVRWDDPLFKIAWPLAPTMMSARDRAFADFKP